MTILLQRANIKLEELRRFVLTTTSKELMLLSEPCYYPDVKKYYYELLNQTGLTDSDVKESIKILFKGLPAEQWKLQVNPYTNLLVFIMHYFLINKDQAGYNSTMLLLTIMHYSNLMNKFIKYCNKNTFKYTLDNISKNHIFKREETISNAIFFFAKDFQRLHTQSIMKMDAEGIVRFITNIRTRLNQSVKAFASVYYESSEKGLGYKTAVEPSEEDGEDAYIPELKDLQIRSVNNVAKNICVYKIIDQKSLSNSIELTRVNKNVANQIGKCLSNPKYYEDIRFILELFVKNLKSVKDLCGINFYTIVKREMSVKRTSLLVYFKKEVSNLLSKVIKDCRLSKEYNSYSIQTKFYMNLFLAYYLTISLRNSLC